MHTLKVTSTKIWYWVNTVGLCQYVLSVGELVHAFTPNTMGCVLCTSAEKATKRALPQRKKPTRSKKAHTCSRGVSKQATKPRITAQSHSEDKTDTSEPGESFVRKAKSQQYKSMIVYLYCKFKYRCTPLSYSVHAY